MKRILVLAAALFALAAQGQVLTCVKSDSPTGFTLTCAAPNVTPPPPPVAPPASEKPAPIATVYGPDLTGTSGNPKFTNDIPAGAVVRYRYVGNGPTTFTAGGQAHNGTPPNVWVWLEGPRGYLTTPLRMGGQGTAPVEYVVAGEVWFCEQIDAPPGTSWNRYAQVNGASVITPGRGSPSTQPPPR